MSETTRTGPIEWVALTFPGPVLDPRVVPPLQDLVTGGTVRLLDAAVLHKDDDGALTGGEVQDEGVAAFDSLDGDVLELLSEDDLAEIAAGLQPGTTTLVLLWENRWAARFADGVRHAGGVLASHDRIPADRVDAALQASRLLGAQA
jgi:hypothetical protein